MKLTAIFIVLVAVATVASGQLTGTMTSGAYSFTWAITGNQITGTIVVTTAANTWAAVGFSDDNMMPMSDVVIGGNDGTNSFVEDRWITGGRTPANVVYDTTQSITAATAARLAGVLTIRFTRPLNTNDATQDVSLQNNCVWVLWAYGGIVGDFTATPVTGLTGHSANGVFPNRLCSGNLVTPNNAYSFSWAITGNRITGTIVVTTPANTWAAVGFSDDQLMPMSDVVIGGNNGVGRSFVEDRWITNGRIPANVVSDTTQSIIVTSAARANELLTITFTRHLNTNDAQDVSLENRCVWVLWAYGGTVGDFSASPVTGLTGHTAKGVFPERLCSVPAIPIPMTPGGTMATTDGLYRFAWTIAGNQLTGTIVVTTAANTWAAVGFSDDQMMPMSDVVIGGNNGVGRSFVEDRWITNGRTSANVLYDTTQDITVTSATRVSGVLTIRFTRPLNTNDATQDVSLENRCVWVLWAYGGMVGDFTSTPVGNLGGHQARGVFPQQLCSGNAITSPTPTQSPSTPSITLNYNSTTLKLTCTANYSSGYQWTDLSTGNVVSNDSIFYTTIGSNKRDYQCTAYNELASKTAVIKGCNPTICAAKDLYLMCQAYIGWSLPLPPQCFQYH